MFRKILVPAVVSMACLLMVTDFAQAQRRGGGGRGWNNGGNWNSSNRNWNSGTSVGVNVGGVGVYVGPGGNRYYYDGYYRSPSYSGYYSPRYSSYYYEPAYSYSEPSYYYEPSTTYTAPANDTAHIRMILPDPNARVWFDGAPTSQTGTDRNFHTPGLATGVNHTYRIRATWMSGGRETNQERTVNVMAGQTSLVDFSQQPVSEAIPQN